MSQTNVQILKQASAKKANDSRKAFLDKIREKALAVTMKQLKDHAEETQKRSYEILEEYYCKSGLYEDCKKLVKELNSILTIGVELVIKKHAAEDRFYGDTETFSIEFKW